MSQWTLGLPTLKQVLELPVVAAGGPQILAGESGLDNVVRWVHVSELMEIAPLLEGGELVLCTGIALPREPPALRSYARSLSEKHVAAVLIELGRRFSELPTALVNEAQSLDLTLVALRNETRFVSITEAVHTQIVNARLRQLERSEVIHRKFTELSIEGASLESIVSTASELIGQPVILENLSHQIITFERGAVPRDSLLEGWERKSRSVPAIREENEVDIGASWIAVSVGARGENWGRILTPDLSSQTDSLLVLESAATAIALNLLSERDATSVRVRTHQRILTQIVESSYSSIEAISSKSAALGVPLRNRILVGVCVTSDLADRGDVSPSDFARSQLHRHFVEQVTAAADRGMSALIDDQMEATVRMLVSIDRQTDPDSVLDRFARYLHSDAESEISPSGVTIGVGSPVRDLREARRSLTEAEHVATAARGAERRNSYFSLSDIRVRGFIHTLRNDARLQVFVERELARLVEFDNEHGTQHIGTLAAYLDQGRNKSRAAEVLHLSRPALYGRLVAIGKILDADLDDVEVCLSLHVALLGLWSLRSEGGAAPVRRSAR